MPYDIENADPPRELILAAEKYENVHLLEGNRVLGDLTLEQKIQLSHPTKEAHRRYREQIAAKLRALATGGAEIN